MAAIKLLILCASFLSAFAASVANDKCGSSSGTQSGETSKDGYNLLEINVTFALKNYSGGIPFVEGVSCITTTTTEKNDSQHKVKEQIKFGFGGNSKALEQWFQFLGDGPQYNTMMPTDGAGNAEQQQPESAVVSSRSGDGASSGSPAGGSEDGDSLIVPPGNYTFNFTGPDCAVVVVYLAEDYSDTQDQNGEKAESRMAQVAAREEAGTETRPPCMLWVKQGADSGTNCCDDYFEKHCSSASTNYVGSGDTCTSGSTISSPKKSRR
ncbi:uncharacterized protein LOC119402234 [Rhipicephalus sanguineus]|uniref:uncharacterized protein LOC119402234 n=1 Tax=Rhipicephalus sanguineus TaxID=34632 RepID=UPI0018953A66|nr:uncharacterized protein LOC119402234 [Rhipicephalus sanguineus]